MLHNSKIRTSQVTEHHLQEIENYEMKILLGSSLESFRPHVFAELSGQV
jgi:hypothetical protein